MGSCTLTVSERSLHESLLMGLGYTSLYVMDCKWRNPWGFFWKGQLQVESGSGEKAFMVALIWSDLILGAEDMYKVAATGTCTHAKNPTCIMKNSPDKVYKKWLKTTWEVMHILTLSFSIINQSWDIIK